MLDFYSTALKLVCLFTTMRQKEFIIVILRVRWPCAFRFYKVTEPESSCLFNYFKTWIKHTVEHVFFNKSTYFDSSSSSSLVYTSIGLLLLLLLLLFARKAVVLIKVTM